ncbi:MAG: alpha/beta fold hydrolase [Acidimicrobiia bacterium]
MPGISRPVLSEEIGLELVRDWVPVTAPRAHIVLVHGIAEHCGRYERTGSLLADAGFFVRSFDLIGFGGSGGRRGDIENWSRYHDQIQTHMEWARGQGGPVILMGHSMGGNLALGYALSGRPAPDLLVLSAPALGGGAGWQRAVAGVAAAVAPTVAVPNSLKGEQLSRDPAVGEAYFSDPLVYRKSTTRLGAAFFEAMDELEESFRDLDIPTLVLHGSADTIVPPQSTAILGELANVERRLLPGLRHEILNEPEGPELIQDIVDWIDARI